MLFRSEVAGPGPLMRRWSSSGDTAGRVHDRRRCVTVEPRRDPAGRVSAPRGLMCPLCSAAPAEGRWLSPDWS